MGEGQARKGAEVRERVVERKGRVKRPRDKDERAGEEERREREEGRSRIS